MRNTTLPLKMTLELMRAMFTGVDLRLANIHRRQEARAIAKAQSAEDTI
jgi:hypothetical protein